MGVSMQKVLAYGMAAKKFEKIQTFISLRSFTDKKHCI
jgi:hypothetical protein